MKVEDYVFLDFHKEENIKKSKLLIASYGINSTIRNTLYIPTNGFHNNETELVSTLRKNKSSNMSYQRFIHYCFFALIPLYDCLYLIVCSIDKHQ